MENNTEQERLLHRTKTMSDCRTPSELSFVIWSKGFEEAVGSSRDAYRNAFVDWVQAYRDKVPPKQWTKYRTPEELVNDIWRPYLDRPQDTVWFTALRKTVSEWIKNYAQQTV